MGSLFGFSIRSTAVILRRLAVNNIHFTHMSTTVAKSLTGKVAVVTASTDGIGFAIAKRLAQDGAKVVVSSRKQKNVDKAVKELQNENLDVWGITCHVGLKEDREKIFQEAASKFGGIDILVSNAAVNPVFGSILDCSEESWDKIFDINVKAAFLLVKGVTPYLEKRGGGSVVIVSSIAGFQPMPGLGAYSVSKTALLGLTKALSQQLASSKIRVNCIAPGVIQTKFSSMLVENDPIREKILENVPVQRIGEPHEMGGLASFLCSDDASYITGETIVASGGMVSRL